MSFFGTGGTHYKQPQTVFQRQSDGTGAVGGPPVFTGGLIGSADVNYNAQLLQATNEASAADAPNTAGNIFSPVNTGITPAYVGATTATPPLAGVQESLSDTGVPTAAGTPGMPTDTFVGAIVNANHSWRTWLTWGIVAVLGVLAFRHFSK